MLTTGAVVTAFLTQDTVSVLINWPLNWPELEGNLDRFIKWYKANKQGPASVSCQPFRRLIYQQDGARKGNNPPRNAKGQSIATVTKKKQGL